MTRPNARTPSQVTNMSAKLKLHCRSTLARRHTVKQISWLASSGPPQCSMLLTSLQHARQITIHNCRQRGFSLELRRLSSSSSNRKLFRTRDPLQFESALATEELTKVGQYANPLNLFIAAFRALSIQANVQGRTTRHVASLKRTTCRKD